MELVLALAISSIVLAGVIYLSTSAMRYQTESVFRNRVTTSALYSAAAMRQELENASYLQAAPGGCATLSGSGCDMIAGCVGWSAIGGTVSGAGGTSFYYCKSGTQLYRYGAAGCNPNFSASCGSAGYSDIVIADPPGIYETQPIFVKTGDSGVDLHYIIGYPGMKSNQPVPVDSVFNIHINTNKAYTDTTD